MIFLQEGNELSRQNNSELLEISYILEISSIYQVRGQLDQAEKDILLALRTAEKINSLTNLSLIHERLVEIEKEKGNYRSALEHFEAFHATYKKLFNSKSDQRIKNLEILHQTEITREKADFYRELAGTDFLTTLVNRRQFLEVAELAFEHIKIEQGQLAIIMLDIDHFKGINDRYGHKAGDEVLFSIASTIKKTLRQGDIAGRHGGEEFIVLVSGTSPDISSRVAERIRQAVERASIEVDGTSINMTISLGLVYIDLKQMLPLSGWNNFADQALYLAKQQGRNRVVEWKHNVHAILPDPA